MRITMIGHSTILLEGAGTRLITDPYFGTFGHLAFSRTSLPSMKREEVGTVDAALVSHGHWDHTDRRFFRGLDAAVPVLAPSGTSLIMKLKGVRHHRPMKPWEEIEIGSATVTAVPALHIARSIGFVVQMDGAIVYFAGDTYHRPFMKEIGRRFALDVAMMPVTSFRIPPTMGERGAVAAARDLGARAIVPIHLAIQPRAFPLRTSQSPASFAQRLHAAGLKTEVVHLSAGEHWNCIGVPDQRGVSDDTAKLIA